MRALLAACLFLTACGAEIGDAPSLGGGSGVQRGSCKVDVVLGVFNSSSTAKEQAALRDALPDFADELGDLGDFRIALVDGCPESADFHTRGKSGECNFAGGHRWIDSSSHHVDDELRCVADIDSSGEQCTGNTDEQPLATATTALEAAWPGTGKPNEGFLRSDALLVVLALTNEDEHPVPGATTQHMYDRLVATKGNASRVFFIGMGGTSTCDGPYGPEDDADKLQEVSSMFAPRSVFWDLCGGHLDDGLHDAAKAIARACE